MESGSRSVAAVHEAWVARQASDPKPKKVREGARLDISAVGPMRFGDAILVASQDGLRVEGLAIVLGEPVTGKRKKTIREALVTHSLRLPVPQGKVLAGRTRARPASGMELASAEKQRDGSAYEFVWSSARTVRRTFTKGQTWEQDSEKLLKAMTRSFDFPVQRQALMPGSQESSEIGKAPRPCKADLVVNIGTPSNPRLLVVEGEWKKPGNFESVAQAYEYARRLMKAGKLAGGKELFELSSSKVQKAQFYAVVVANDVPTDCLIAETLNVKRVDYFGFVDLLLDISKGNFTGLDDARQRRNVGRRLLLALQD